MDSIIVAVEIFFFLFCHISIISGTSSKQTNHRFHNGLNVKAQWAEIWKFKTESKIQCSMTCSLKDGCKSLTFHKKNGECVLYSAFKGNMTQEEDANVDYGEKILPVPKDCADAKEADPMAPSGLVDIEICSDGTDRNSCTTVTVYCDMETLGGGWTVFQRRTDGSVNFRRYWNDYKVGFGHPSGEHWLGNDNLFHLTKGSSQELLIELKEWEQDCLISTRYSDFSIGSETDKYRLSVGKFIGGLAGDPMWFHDGMQFSTVDQDNDMSGGSCAISYDGAWWYNNCYKFNLNGKYSDKPCPGDPAIGYIMLHLPGRYYYSYQRAEMKFRPENFRYLQKIARMKR